MGGATSQSELVRAGHASLIAADVGGTHARLALLEAGPRGADDFAILQYRKYACADYPGLSAIIDEFRASLHGIDVDRIALALAGYVIDDAVVNVNLPWTVSISDLRAALGVRDLAIVNDFEAVAYAIGHVDESSATLLSGPLQPALPGPMLVVGPGTGLGAALRIPHAPRPVILSTEAGQATLAAQTDIEFEILRELRKHGARVHIEQVLSGTGLMNLYRTLASLRGKPATLQLPAEITAAALARTDATAGETVDVFCGWLGGVLGDLALLYGAQGGIYLAGGVLPQMKELLLRSTFVERLLDKGAMRQALTRTPVRLIEHAQLGVIGAASWYFDNHSSDVRATREHSHA